MLSVSYYQLHYVLTTSWRLLDFVCVLVVFHRQTSGQHSSARNVITLKMKSENQNHTFILKMCLSEIINHLRLYLNIHR